MKKILFIFLLALSYMGVAQEKGAYIGLHGGLGYGGFNYTLRGIDSNGENEYLPGGHAGFSFGYYFNRHWGIGTGVSFSHYRSQGKYPGMIEKDNYYVLGEYIDDDPTGAVKDYELRARLGNWEEYQSGHFIDIPLMAMYQHKFGKSERYGLYFGIGAKLHIPVMSSYKVIDGEYSKDIRLNVSGYYGDGYPELGEPGSAASWPHGFGSISNPHERYGWEGTLKIKPSISGTAELGILIGMTRRIDILAGGYLDYGFNNIKKEKSALLEGPEDYHMVANGHIGEGINYNGMINSANTRRVNTISYGIKAGLRVKLGKLSEREIEEETESQVELEKQEDLQTIEESLKKIIEMMESGNQGQPRELKIVLDGSVERVVSEDREPVRKVITDHAVKDEDGLTEEDRDILKERVFFDLNSSVLHPGSKIVLDRKVNLMSKYPEMRVRIIGNTCDLGQEKINIPLGLRRAKSVKKYMEGRGISPERLIPATQANSDPLLPNINEENRAINRRCDFEIDRR